jgi:hypothetical protein
MSSEDIMNQIWEVLCELFRPWLATTPAVAAAGANHYATPDAGIAVFNTGGPRSRIRQEMVTASLFPGSRNAARDLGVLRIGKVWVLHSEGQSLRDAAWEILSREGFNEPEAAFDQLEAIPRTRLHCRAVPQPTGFKGAARAEKNPLDYLRTALVLGKCRGGIYDPDGPLIWTENRLGQWLELYEIRESFYD